MAKLVFTPMGIKMGNKVTDTAGVSFPEKVRSQSGSFRSAKRSTQAKCCLSPMEKM